MRSILEITTAAQDKQLLSIAEMRAAASVDANDASKDALLQARGLGVAAAISSECNIAVGNGGDPTLKKETLTERFFRVRCGRELVLSRRHDVVVSSVTVDGTAISSDDYDVDAEEGVIRRRSCRWYGNEVVVVYDAGFDTVPGDLKLAALDFFTALSIGSGRDPFVKQESTEVPGVETVTKQYWVGSVPGGATEDAVPDIVSGQLKRFRNVDAIG